VTVRAIVGLVVFNVLLAALGSAVLSALRPATTRKQLVRLAGVAYLLGVAALMVALTLLIVLGIPVNLLTTVLTGAVIFAAAWLLGRRRRTQPVRGASEPAVLVSMWSAALLALLAVSLEAVFRKGRLQGLIEFDGWDSGVSWNAAKR